MFKEILKYLLKTKNMVYILFWGFLFLKICMNIKTHMLSLKKLYQTPFFIGF